MIELLLYMGIFSLLLVMLTGIFVTSLETQISTQAASSVDHDGRYILSRLTYDMQRSSAIAQPSSPSAQTTSSLRLTINGSPHTYSVTNDTMQVVDATGTIALHSGATTISDLTFQRIGSNNTHDTVQVRFTVTGTEQNTPETRSFQITLGK